MLLTISNKWSVNDLLCRKRKYKKQQECSLGHCHVGRHQFSKERDLLRDQSIVIVILYFVSLFLFMYLWFYNDMNWCWLPSAVWIDFITENVPLRNTYRPEQVAAAGLYYRIRSVVQYAKHFFRLISFPKRKGLHVLQQLIFHFACVSFAFFIALKFSSW